MQIKLLVEGGAMKPGPALSQKIGPLGINMGQVIAKINEATKSFSGINVPVEVNVDPTTKKFDVTVFSPSVSELLKKELKLDKGSGEQNKNKIANASIEQIILVAQSKLPGMLCKDLKTAVKTVTGTCVSLGILIENKTPQEIEREIESGKYDKEIKNEITVTPKEKADSLSKFFDGVKLDQEKKKKVAEAAKLAEEAAKLATATAAGTATATAATATPTATKDAKPAAKPAAKTAEKK